VETEYLNFEMHLPIAETPGKAVNVAVLMRSYWNEEIVNPAPSLKLARTFTEM